MYEKGEGVNQDREEALGWYRKAADAGDIQAQISLAQYLQTQGSNRNQQSKDEHEAFTWWLKAARRGDPEAQLQVGLLLAEGRGTPRNLAQVRTNTR